MKMAMIFGDWKLEIKYVMSQTTKVLKTLVVLVLLFTAQPLHAQNPTPEPSGTICFFVFDDVNQNGRRDPGEGYRAGSNVTIATRTDPVFSYDTDGVSEPFCLDRLPVGVYFVNYNPTGEETATTAIEQVVNVAQDDTVEVSFGSYAPPPTSTAVPTATNTPLPTLPAVGPTATPNTEGVIYIEVIANDSLTSVAYRGGITLAQLLELNGLTESSLIHPGDLLIVGVATPEPTATIEVEPPTETPTRLPPTATNTAVPPPRTALCLLAFDDPNQNGIYEAGEGLKTAVAFTIFNNQAVVGNLITNGQSDPQCLDLPSGSYQVTRSARPEETLTTEGNGIVVLGRGDVVQLSFGSVTALPPPANQPITAATDTPLAPTPLPMPTPIPSTTPDTTGSPPLIIGGVIVFLLIAGLLVYQLMRKSP